MSCRLSSLSGNHWQNVKKIQFKLSRSTLLNFTWVRGLAFITCDIIRQTMTRLQRYRNKKCTKFPHFKLKFHDLVPLSTTSDEQMRESKRLFVSKVKSDNRSKTNRRKKVNTYTTSMHERSAERINVGNAQHSVSSSTRSLREIINSSCSFY